MSFMTSMAKSTLDERLPPQVKRKLREAQAQLAPESAMWRRFAYAGAAEFPEWFRKYTPPLFGTAFYAALPKLRHTVQDTQARLLGLEPDSLAARVAAYKMYVEFAHCLTDALEMSGKPDRLFDRHYVNEHHFHEVRARGKGAILVTAHTGSWEVGGRLLNLVRDVRTTMVMAEEANEGARRYVDELRKRSGVEVVYASGNDPATAITLLQRLRNNEVVAIQIDRAGKVNNLIQTELFGAPWPVPEGPFRLAQASGASIIPVFLRRSGYRAYTFTLADPIEVPRTRDADTLKHAAQKASAALEKFLREHPEQWFHFGPMPT